MSEFEPEQSELDPRLTHHLMGKLTNRYVLIPHLSPLGESQFFVVPRETLLEQGVHSDDDLRVAGPEAAAKIVRSIIVPELN